MSRPKLCCPHNFGRFAEKPEAVFCSDFAQKLVQNRNAGIRGALEGLEKLLRTAAQTVRNHLQQQAGHAVAVAGEKDTRRLHVADVRLKAPVQHLLFRRISDKSVARGTDDLPQGGVVRQRKAAEPLVCGDEHRGIFQITPRLHVRVRLRGVHLIVYDAPDHAGAVLRDFLRQAADHAEVQYRVHRVPADQGLRRRGGGDLPRAALQDEKLTPIERILQNLTGGKANRLLRRAVSPAQRGKLHRHHKPDLLHTVLPPRFFSYYSTEAERFPARGGFLRKSAEFPVAYRMFIDFAFRFL